MHMQLHEKKWTISPCMKKRKKKIARLKFQQRNRDLGEYSSTDSLNRVASK